MGGILVLIRAFQPAPPPRPRSQRRATRPLWSKVSTRTKASLLLGVVVGLISASLSGIIVLVLIAPVAFVGLPLLLSKQDTTERDLLSALEAWTRSLAATADTGTFTLREVIDLSRTAAPPILRVTVDRLNNRMSGSWSNTDALRAFADELDSAWADEVVIYLIQAAEFNAGGLSTALEGLADNLATQVKQRRLIYNERDKPRRTLVQMTGIVGFVLACIVVFSGSPQLASFSTPLGQSILVVIIGMFALILVWAKSQSKTLPDARIIQTISDGART
ncbi:type II secretion system F family protein (plasmid) [Clavibacter sepedonicus]|uniref:type II secretion system F family protein n=1 Tax=Clavibacter sepedonicus TaxID=31964 RepID=UPI00211A1746|nr:type II secretion system F family protein [Clavibacter sepedonicus]UUK67243.1 type II secretion system F family protein [Clavibacter sepedonicus]